MAVKRKSKKIKEIASVSEPVEVAAPKWHVEDGVEPLDPEEEKMLDWILKGIVIFILGWLGLSVLLVIGGYFGLWK